MAIYAKFDAGRPVNDIRVCQLPAAGVASSGDASAFWLRPSPTPTDSMATLGSGLNVRFDEGGVTTWERPDSTGTP